MICQRVFLQLGLTFSSDREDFLVKIFNFLSLVLFGPFAIGAKVENKWNNKSSETILWAVTHSSPLVWLVVESNKLFYVVLLHSTVSSQFKLHLWGQSENVFTSTFSSWFSSSVFSLPIHNVFWVNVSRTSHQIPLPYCAWGDTTNPDHPW